VYVADALDELAASMAEYGRLRPWWCGYWVRTLTKRVDRRTRRFAAAQQLGWKRIASVVRDVPDDGQADLFALVTPTGTTNHWFAAYDVRQFVDPTRFVRDVQGVRQRVQNNPPRAGFERVHAPGDLENDNARTYLRDGIPLEQFTLDELACVAEHTGVPLPFRANGQR
jgi:hypothetical protein